MASESTSKEDEVQMEKSSTEILSELFEMFDKESPSGSGSDKNDSSESSSDSDSSNRETSEPPVAEPDKPTYDSEQSGSEDLTKDESETVKKKKKKDKKNKHKHKHKDKHKHKKKKKKHKHKSRDSKTSKNHDSKKSKKQKRIKDGSSEAYSKSYKGDDSKESKKLKKAKDLSSESHKKAKKRKHSAHSSEDCGKRKAKRSRSQSPEVGAGSPLTLTITADAGAGAGRTVRKSDETHGDRSPRVKHRRRSSGDGKERRRSACSRRSRSEDSRSRSRSRSPVSQGDLETATPAAGGGGGGWQTVASPPAERVESPSRAATAPASRGGGWTTLSPVVNSAEPAGDKTAQCDLNTSSQTDAAPHSETAAVSDPAPRRESLPLPEAVPLPESAPPVESVPLPPEPVESGAATPTDQDDQPTAQAAPEAGGRPAKRGAIVIRSLKNSAVFEQAEEEARRRQAERESRYEDGELTDSSSGQDESRPASPEPQTVSTCKTDAPAEEDVEKSDVREDPADEEEGEITSDVDEAVDKKKSKGKAKKSHKKGRDKKGRDGSDHRKSRHRSESSTRHRDKGRDKDRDRSPHDPSHSRHGHRDRHRSSKRRRDSRSTSRERRRSRGGDRDHKERDRPDWDQHDHRERDRDRDRGDLREKIDKRRLLEVARRNALKLGQEGLLPASLEAVLPDPRRNTAKNVRQLTELCRRLRDEDSDDGGGGGGRARAYSDDEAPFHHPFAVKERASHIVMNIRNAPQLPVKTHAERQADVAKLSSNFPVSSGEQHRTKELEWVPVEPDSKKKKAAPKAIEAAPAEDEPAAPQPVPAPEPAPAAPDPADSVFPAPPPAPEVDLNTIVSRRLTAMRQLQQNPYDRRAQSLMDSAQQDMQDWAASRQQPGRFNGSTGARVLSAAELGAGQQAWAKKNQLKTSAPITGGMGELLLKKMGWKPGQGLGKNQDGSLTPLLLDVKMDKKGLVSEDERPGGKKQAPVTLTNVKDVGGKHPISALMELCTKRRWGPPDFQLSMDRGPAHSKHFLYKVTVNTVTYQPSVDSTNKKLAKASAAAAALQALGLLPA